MGNRASVSFRNKGLESVTLCDHWGGRKFHQEAKAYVKKLKQAGYGSPGQTMRPIDRLEPDIVMLNFAIEMGERIKKELNMSVVPSSLYLGATPNDVDNSNCGHVTIDIEGVKI